MDKLKILFLSNWFPLANKPSQSIFVKRHLEALNLFAEVSSVIINVEPSKKLYQCRKTAVKNAELGNFTQIEIHSLFWKYITYLPSLQYFIVKRQLKKNKNLQFDFVQTNTIFMSGLFGAKISKYLKVPLVHVEHWTEINNFLDNNFYRKSALNALKQAEAIVCVSNFSKADFHPKIGKTKIHVIGNVLESKFIPTAKPKSDKIRFLAIAHWSLRKNPELFVNALTQIAETTNHKFELTIIGDGILMEAIKKKKHPFKVEYLPSMNNDELPHFFQHTDIFLHASSFETFSIVPLESLMTGTPVVVSKVGVLPEIVTPENGVLCENTLESWVEGIEVAMATKYDANTIFNTINGKFSTEQISNEFKELYLALKK